MSVIAVNPESRLERRDGEVGEIWVAGTCVADGYWQRPEESRSVFQAYTADGRGPYLKTGDLGFRTDGQIFISGRLKDLIIVRGINHYAEDIEQTAVARVAEFSGHAGAAFAVEPEALERNGAERLVVAFETSLKRMNESAVESLFQRLRKALADEHDLDLYALAVLAENRLPRTSSGKIQRRACRALWFNGELDSVAEWRFGYTCSASESVVKIEKNRS